MSSPSESRNATADHILGFALAVVLTAIPFTLVWLQSLARDMTMLIIGMCAILQIAVHMWFFLEIRPRSHEPWKLISLTFGLVVMVIMVGGTIWIMTNLALRMGH